MKIDMEPHAIAMRIKKASELRRLCIALGGERLKRKWMEDRERTLVFEGRPGVSKDEEPSAQDRH
jgi:hypothetical protein